MAPLLALFQMVCEAVAAAHRQLVIHCDIKPSNVLVNSDGQAMLLDFGIAQLEGQVGGGVAMTPGFASPEQCAGLPSGIPSDVYGLGRLLAVLLQPIGAGHRRGQELGAIVAGSDPRLMGLPELPKFLPLAEADALRRLALAHNNSGQAELGEAPARRALALRQRHDPQNLPDIADAENRLGIVMLNLRRYPEAAQLIEHALQSASMTRAPTTPTARPPCTTWRG